MRLPKIGFVLVLALGATAGCAGEAEPQRTQPPAAQPAEDAPVFVEGDFGTIPIHPLAEEAGTKTQEDGVVAQSFTIRNTSTDDLFAWYHARLSGWTQETAPQVLGGAEAASWRATWTRGEQRLIVTVSEAPETATEGGAEPEVLLQYSLSLEPIGRPAPGTAETGAE